ncbi:MAG: molybdenum cofactor guanylyltransferase MobA [Pseudomonadota bacterium]
MANQTRGKLQSEIPTLILAGGLSRRMGGTNKTLLKVAGTPLIEHVIRRIKPQIEGPLAINSNHPPEDFSAFGLPVISDPVGGRVGPLAGVLAGLLWARDMQTTASHLLTVPGDVPFLPSDLVSQLTAAAHNGEQPPPIVVAASAERTHGVIGLWSVALCDPLLAALEAGERTVLRWVERCGMRVVQFDETHIGGHTIDPFFNVNTPDDLALADRVLQAIE